MNKALKGTLFVIAVFSILISLPALAVDLGIPLKNPLNSDFYKSNPGPNPKKPKIDNLGKNEMNPTDENNRVIAGTQVTQAPSPQPQESSDSEEEIYDEEGYFLDEELRNIQISIELACAPKEANPFFQDALNEVEAYSQQNERAFRACFALIDSFFIRHKDNGTLSSDVCKRYQTFAQKNNQTPPPSRQLQESNDSEEEIYDEEGCYTDEFFKYLRTTLDLAGDYFDKDSKKYFLSMALNNFEEAIKQKKDNRVEFKECFSILKNNYSEYIFANLKNYAHLDVFNLLKEDFAPRESQ